MPAALRVLPRKTLLRPEADSGAVGAPLGNGSTYRIRCLSGNIWKARLFADATASSPTAICAESRRCCSIPVTLIFPHRAVDDADNECILLLIAARSRSFRIEPIPVPPLPELIFDQILTLRGCSQSRQPCFCKSIRGVQLLRRLIVRYRQVLLVFLFVDFGPHCIVLRRFRIEPDKFVQIGQGEIIVLLLVMRDAAVLVALRVRGRKLDGLRQIGYRKVVLSFQVVNYGAIRPRIEIVRIGVDRSTKIRQCQVVIFGTVLRVSSRQEGLGRLRI